MLSEASKAADELVDVLDLAVAQIRAGVQALASAVQQYELGSIGSPNMPFSTSPSEQEPEATDCQRRRVRFDFNETKCSRISDSDPD